MIRRSKTRRSPQRAAAGGKTAAQRSKNRGHKRVRGRRRWIGLLFKLGLASLVFYGAIAGVYYLLALRYNLAELHEMPERTIVYGRNGEVLGRFGEENRVVIGFDEVPATFVNALLAREDTRFYQHIGVDPIGIARAAVRNLLMGGIRQGGSTITQQLARNSFPLGGRNYHRKLLEAALSFRIETEITKEEILESYINRIYFGSGCYGLETASRTYFNKPAKSLTLAESALLAGLIRSPTRLSPLNDPEASVVQRNVVLNRMRELDWITESERLAAVSEPLRLSPQPRVMTTDNWAMDIVRRELELILRRLGYDDAGLIVHSTLDGALQKETEAVIARRLQEIEGRAGFPHRSRKEALAAGDSGYLQAAVILLDHRNGGILALAGGRDYTTSNYNRVLLAHRQAGSVVKPFVYAHALEKGLKPGERISDARLSPSEIPRKYGAYDPANADRKYEGNRQAVDSVVHSRNTMTVRIGLRAGIESTARLLKRAGIAQNPPLFPSLFLGAFETNLRDLTSAMTAFPNAGNQVHPFVIREIQDIHGRVLYRHREIRTPLLDPAAARQTFAAMEEVFTRGTAASARALGHRGKAAGKTGTTNNFQDAWFVGSAQNLTAGVWVGFDRPRQIYEGGGGAQAALPIWVDIINSAPAAPYRK